MAEQDKKPNPVNSSINETKTGKQKVPSPIWMGIQSGLGGGILLILLGFFPVIGAVINLILAAVYPFLSIFGAINAVKTQKTIKVARVSDGIWIGANYGFGFSSVCIVCAIVAFIIRAAIGIFGGETIAAITTALSLLAGVFNTVGSEVLFTPIAIIAFVINIIFSCAGGAIGAIMFKDESD